MALKEQVAQELDTLGEDELRQLADFLAYLKFRHRSRLIPSGDEAQWEALGAEFAAEDRALADAGFADYARGLAAEDAA